MEEDIPQWQKDLIRERMLLLRQHPDEVTSLEDFIAELDQEDEDTNSAVQDIVRH